MVAHVCVTKNITEHKYDSAAISYANLNYFYIKLKKNNNT